jgi:hypothetical protein
MTTHHTLAPATRFKSPVHGGFRGPTSAQPRRILNTTAFKSPQHWGDVGGPYHAPTPAKAVPEEEEEELKQKNKPTFARVSAQPTYT